MVTDNSPYVTAKELAAHVRGSVDEVYKKAQNGDIPVAFRWGPELRFDLNEVMKTLKETS